MAIANGKYDRGNGIHGVPAWRIIGFTGLNLAINLYMGITMQMSYFLNGFVGMAVILASSFSTIMRLWDGVTDPIVGFIVDKFDFRIGKTRLCILIGGLLALVNSFFMFRVTNYLPENGIIRSIWFTFFALVFYIGYTFLNVGMHTGNVCITNDPKQRPLVSVTGTLLVRLSRSIMQMVLAALVVKYGRMSALGVFEDYWLVTAVAATVCLVIAYYSIAPKDNPTYGSIGRKTKNKDVRFSDYARVLKTNRPLQMLIVSAATDKIASSCRISVITIIIFGIVCGNYSLNGGWNLYTTIIGLIMMVFGIGGIGRKYGMKKSVVLGSWGTIIFNFLAILLFLFFDPKTLNLPGYTNGYGEAFTGFTLFTVALFLFSVLGEGSGMICNSAIPAMIADINDYEASRSGKYISGMVATIYTFIDKLISSAAPLLVGLVLAAIGFSDKLPDVNTPYSTALFITGISFYYGLVVIGAVCNVIAMRFYDLTPEVMEEVREKVAELRKA